MDQESDIYENIEGPSCNLSKWTRETQRFHTPEPNRTGAARSGAGDVRRSSCRAGAVFLGLLFLLLLTGLIALVFIYIKCNSERKMEVILLKTRHNNLTEERDQLQKRFEDMAKERNDLQRKLQDPNGQLGWLYFSGRFYFISPLKKSWQESRDDCLQRGADLVIINSKEEEEFMRNFQRLTWIGLTDRETEGTWKWVDGTPLTTSYWNPNEPNGVQGRDEDCAEIKIHDLVNGWNDESCDLKRFWMCEKT